MEGKCGRKQWMEGDEEKSGTEGWKKAVDGMSTRREWNRRVDRKSRRVERKVEGGSGHGIEVEGLKGEGNKRVEEESG